MSLPLLALATIGCRGTIGYYVSNVYTTPSGLAVERCEINGLNGHTGEPDHGAADPKACHLEPVGPAPGTAPAPVPPVQP